MNKIGVFGATGLIGRTFIKVLNEEKIKGDFKFFASYKSFGKRIYFNHKYYNVLPLNETSFKDITHAFFFLPSKVVESLLVYVKKYKIKVIDNSSLLRLNPKVPLVIDEINGQDLKDELFISNPNCSTIQSVLPLFYLNKVFDIKEINYVTYQSISGGGNKLLKEYKHNTLLKCAYPFIGNIDNNSYSEEENKMVLETKKLLKKKIKIRAFCSRIPALYTHSTFIDVTFKNEVDIEKAKKVLTQKRIKYCPSSKYLKDKNYIVVTRLRKDLYDKNRLQFFTMADNLRVGAAYNSFLIAKRLKIF